MIDGTFATGPLVRVLLIVWTGASRQLLRSSSVATVDIIIVAGQVQLQTVHVPVQDPTQHTHTGVIVQRDARMGWENEYSHRILAFQLAQMQVPDGSLIFGGRVNVVVNGFDLDAVRRGKTSGEREKVV